MSPTREKLEPTIPRNDDPRGSQKNSPKKNSPQKTLLQKRNLQKIKSTLSTNPLKSVLDVVLDLDTQAASAEQQSEKRSPKRQSRSVAAKDRKSISGNESLTRRPRPCTYVLLNFVDVCQVLWTLKCTRVNTVFELRFLYRNLSLTTWQLLFVSLNKSGPPTYIAHFVSPNLSSLLYI